MAVTLVFKATKSSIGSVELDASVSETHQGDVDVTEHPVERGANIADHARPKPESITIEGLISNTPLPAPNGQLTKVTSGSAEFDSRSELQPTRSGQAYADLLALKDRGELLTVVTALRVYDNMILTSLSVPRDARTGQALRFSATLKQVKVVTSQLVKVVAVQKAQPKVKLGKKGTPETPPATRGKSGAKYLKDTGVIQDGFSKLTNFVKGFVP